MSNKPIVFELAVQWTCVSLHCSHPNYGDSTFQIHLLDCVSWCGHGWRYCKTCHLITNYFLFISHFHYNQGIALQFWNYVLQRQIILITNFISGWERVCYKKDTLEKKRGYIRQKGLRIISERQTCIHGTKIEGKPWKHCREVKSTKRHQRKEMLLAMGNLGRPMEEE